MSRIHPECPDSDPSDRLVATDVVLRQEPAKKTKRKTKATARKMRMMTRKTRATRSERTPIYSRGASVREGEKNVSLSRAEESA